MSKNVGKIFEDNFKKSIPEHIFVYRPPDAAQAFGEKNSKLRFSSHSPCDYFLFDGKMLYTFELKSVAGKSISFERDKNDKGVIHHYQVKSLKKFGEYKNVTSGFIIDFRGSENTYFLNINDWENIIGNIDKKSFNEEDLLTYSSPILICKRKLRTNYKYDIVGFLNELNKK